MALIAFRDVDLAYQGKVVTSKVNFQVNKGDYLCIVGENGSGKSTLIKALLGLKSIASGEILLGEGLKQSHIGYLPQQTTAQKEFPATVEEVVLSGCLNRCGLRPFYNRHEKSLAKEKLESMGIAQIAKKSYRELSGGQQQRVLLARALCATQQVLLLDEPVSGLDPMVSAEMYELIEALNKKENITIIMVSHDISAAVQYGTHILHMSNPPLFFGSKEDYMKTDIGRAFSALGRRKGNAFN